MNTQPCAHVAVFFAQQVMAAELEHRPFAQAVFFMDYQAELARATPQESDR